MRAKEANHSALAAYITALRCKQSGTHVPSFSPDWSRNHNLTECNLACGTPCFMNRMRLLYTVLALVSPAIICAHTSQEIRFHILISLDVAHAT
jgi:hypothetical protein